MAGWRNVFSDNLPVALSSKETHQLKPMTADGCDYPASDDGRTRATWQKDLPAPNGYADFEPFCTSHSLDQCISYINQEFISLGIASLYCPETDEFELTRMVNSTYSLLQRLHRGVQLRDELEDSKHRALSDLEHIQQEKKKLKTVADQLKRDLSQGLMKEHRLIKVNNTVNGKLKTEKEEVKRLLALMQNRDVQYRHSIRKIESEVMKLKERLHSLLVEKTDRKISIDMSETLVRSDGKRAKWKTGCSVDDVYRGVMSNSEEKQKALLLENEELRLGMKEIHAQLTSLLSSGATEMRNNELRLGENNLEVSASDDVIDDVIHDGLFQMPYEIVAEGIMASISQQIALLRQRIERLQISDVRDLERQLEEERHTREVEKLQKKVERYRSLVEHTQKLCKHNTSAERLLRTMSLADANVVRGTLRWSCHSDDEAMNMKEDGVLGKPSEQFDSGQNGFYEPEFQSDLLTLSEMTDQTARTKSVPPAKTRKT